MEAAVKKLIPILVILVAFAAVPTFAEQGGNCLTCHQAFEEEDGPAYKFTRDIHYQKGILCADCHGGDPGLDDMDEVRASKGYRGVPDFLSVPQFCADCHSDPAYMGEHNPALPTDQLAKYKTSVHGKLLFGKKDTKVANCVSCHSVHNIGTAQMPHSTTHPQNIPSTCGTCHADADYMAGYGIPTDQLEDYRASVHGRALLDEGDLGAPACNDCHGNHGASPPGVSSLAAVCGNCHAFQMELFNESPHKEAFAENDFPMCETCHGNHRITSPSDELVGTNDPALCVECHSSDDGTRAFESARTISASLADLVSAHKQADSVLGEARERGMMTTDEEFRLQEVKQTLIQTRTLVHSFDGETVASEAQQGIAKADTVQANAASLIDEYYFRRKGLGLATLFITILAIALYLKIRRLD